MGYPGGSERKESAYNEGDPGSIPGLGRSLREGNGAVFCLLWLLVNAANIIASSNIK